MLVAVYLAGIVAVALFVTCCGFAREGVGWAKTASWVEVWILLALASFGLLLAFAVMLAGGRESADSWWSHGLGQQFVVIVLGWLALAGAGLSIHQRLYQSAIFFMIVAAVLFGLWGLLVDAGWSNKGPLAFV
jgi:hypothetical protein